MLNRESQMRKYLLAATALAMFATPAVAKDNSGYVGLEIGALFPKDPNGSAFVDFNTVNSTIPAGGVAVFPPGPSDFTFGNPFDFNVKTGWDGDLIAGYDFGMFRVEGELGYKHSKVNSDASSAFLGDLNAGLNRPSAPPDPGAPGLPALVTNDFRLDDSMHVWSAMLNGMVDFGGQEGLGGYLGAGIGYAGVHFADSSQGKFAWQVIGGVYYPISESIDIGLKGRYFQTGSIDSDDEVFTFAGNPNVVDIGPAAFTAIQTTDAIVGTHANARFKSISLLLSLVYNFGAAAPPPMPAPPPPPPPPPPPATQTCPDASVILATDACPPPPPPPPPPPVERGERGN